MEEERTHLPFPTIVIRVSHNSRQKIDALLKPYELNFLALQAQWIEKENSCILFKMSENCHRLVIPLTGFQLSLNLHLHWDSLTFSYHLKEDNNKDSIVLSPEEMADHYGEAGWKTGCLLRFIEEQEAYFPQPDLLALYKKVEQLEVNKESSSDKAQQLALWSSYIEGEEKYVEKLQVPIGVNYFHPLEVVALPDEKENKYYHLTLNLKEDESQARMEKQIGVVLSRSDFGKPAFDRWENRFFLKGMKTLSEEVLRGVERVCLKHHYSFEPEPVHIIEGRVDLRPNPALQPIFEEISAQLKEESGVIVDFDAWGDAQISLEALPVFDQLIEERYDKYVKRNPALGCIIKIAPYQRIDELEEELKALCPSIELGLNGNRTKLYVSHVRYNTERVKKRVEDWGFRFHGEAKKVSVLNGKAIPDVQQEFLNRLQLSSLTEEIKSKGNLTGIILPDLQTSSYGELPFFYKKVEAEQEFGEVHLKNFENFLGTLYGEQNLEVTNELLFEQDDPVLTIKTAFESGDWLDIRQACQPLGVKVYEEQNAIYFEFKTTQELERKIESLKRMKLFTLNYKPLYYKYKVRTEWTSYNLDNRKQILEEIADELSVFPGVLTLKYTNEECTMAFLKYAYSSRAELMDFKEAVRELNEQSETFDISIKDEEGVTSYYFSKFDQGQLGFDQQIKAIKSQEIFIMPQDYSSLLQQLKEMPDNSKEALLKRRIRGLSRKKLNIGQVVYYNTPLKQITLRLDERQKNNFSKALTGGPLQYDLDQVFPRFRRSTAKIKRLKTALAELKELAQLPAADRGFVNPNLGNFIFDSSAAKPIVRESLKPDSEAYALLEEYRQMQLNALQRSAVLKAVLAEDLALIEGATGTGKTTILGEIAWQLIVRNRQPAYKVLITSATNLAVDNAFEKLKYSGHTIVKPVRFGDADRFEGEGKKYSLARMKRWCEGYDDHLISEPDSADESGLKNNAIRAWMMKIAEKSKHSAGEHEDLCDILEEWQKDLRAPEVKDRKVFYEKYLKHVNVVGSACASVGSRSFNNDFNTLFGSEMENGDQEETKNYLSFDTVIVEEAGEVKPAELVLPLRIAKKSILMGDKKRLPSLFLKKFFSRFFQERQEENKAGLKQNASYLQDSQFKQMIENLDISDTLICQLETQYRMHEDILAVTQPFYPGGLKSGITSHQDEPYTLNHSASRYHGIYNTLKKETDAAQFFLTPDTHVLWVDVDTPEINKGMSRINRGEVEAVKRVLEYLRYADGFDAYQKHWKQKGMTDEIGLISFYKPQIDLLEEAKQYARQLGINTRLKTVNQFQGMERNIVIISTVRSDKIISSSGRVRSNERNLEHPAYSPWGFAESPEWLNTALSRAKSLLIVVGNKNHFENYKNPQGEAVYKNAIRVIEEKGKVIHYKELVKYES